MADIFSICDRHIPFVFKFLIDEFGFTGPEKIRHEGPKGYLYFCYTNQTTGIVVGYSNEFSSLDVFLSRGHAVVPMMPSDDQACSLDWILEVINPTEAARYQATGSLSDKIALGAVLVKKECADIIKGDFSVFARVWEYRKQQEMIDRWSEWFQPKWPVYIVCGSTPYPRGKNADALIRPCTTCKTPLLVSLPLHRIFMDRRSSVPICARCLETHKPAKPRVVFDGFDTSILAKATPDLKECRRYIPSSFQFLIDEFGFEPPKLLSSIDPPGMVKVSAFQQGEICLANAGAPQGSLFYEYSRRSMALLIGFSPSGGYQIRFGQKANGNVPNWFVEDDQTCLLTDLLDVQDPDAAHLFRRNTYWLARAVESSAELLQQKGVEVLRGDFRFIDLVCSLRTGTNSRRYRTVFSRDNQVYVLCSGAEAYSVEARPCSFCRKDLGVEQAFNRSLIRRQNAAPICWDCFKKAGRKKTEGLIKLGFDNILNYED